MISYTSDNDFFKGKIESFSVTRFLLELTQHIPPRGLQYIRRYGLYAPQRWIARTKGKWPDIRGAPSPCDAAYLRRMEDRTSTGL